MTMQKILIVDDKEENLYLLNALLQGHGYQTIPAHHGADALEKAGQNPPDMIIADILMPVMDGFALCRACKTDERLKSIPFIFYTATYTDERDRLFALSLGADRFVVKPEEPEVFLAVIRETFRSVKPSSIAAAPLPAEAAGEESVYLKQYNEVLIRKLEKKMEQLEQTNRELLLDIAARKQAEANISASEKNYRELFENAVMGISEATADGRLVLANMAYARMYGYDNPEQMIASIYNIGQQLYVCPEEREKVLQILHKNGHMDPREFAVKRRDGTPFFVFVSAREIRDAGGKVIRYQATHVDITKRKQAEDLVRKLNDELEQKVQERTEELKRTITKLEELNRVFIGRELKMAELKARIAGLEKKD
ncbi:MAG: response regulator [Deltaproteobacteria bacterium]